MPAVEKRRGTSGRSIRRPLAPALSASTLALDATDEWIERMAGKRKPTKALDGASAPEGGEPP
jgi:hypothetical protein